MKENSNTCPVCFTKMRGHKDGLICPECGYKLCDHKYKSQDIYDTSHTHTPEYTTSYPAARTGSVQNTTSSANRTNNMPSQSNIDERVKKIPKIVRIIVIVYAVSIILSVLSTFFSAFLAQFRF